MDSYLKIGLLLIAMTGLILFSVESVDAVKSERSIDFQHSKGVPVEKITHDTVQTFRDSKAVSFDQQIHNFEIAQHSHTDRSQHRR